MVVGLPGVIVDVVGCSYPALDEIPIVYSVAERGFVASDGMTNSPLAELVPLAIFVKEEQVPVVVDLHI